MRLRMFIVIVLLAVVLGGVFGWKLFSNHMRDQSIANMQAPPVTVAAVPAEVAEWESTLRVTGEVIAIQGVSVSGKVAGIVRDIRFQSGDRVEAGDPLVALDTAEDRARLEGLRADARLARATRKRKRELRDRELGSQAELDEARARAAQTAAAVVAQEELIAKKIIRAPFAGRLGIREVDLGEYLSPGTGLAMLQRLDEVYVDFNVPQERIAALSPGQSVEVRVAGYSDTFKGTVEALDPALDTATRTVRVRARVANEDERLRPGMYGNVELSVGPPEEFLTIRQTAIAYNTYGDSVWVVVPKDGDGEDGLTAERRTVKTGRTRGDQVQILDGIEAGDRVVVSGNHKLRPNATVKVDNKALPSDAADPENVENY